MPVGSAGERSFGGVPVRRWAAVLVLALLLAGGGAALWRAGHARPVATAAEQDTPMVAAPASPAAPSTRRCPDEDRLARAFAPALAIAPDDQQPRPIEMLLDRAHIVYRDGDRLAEESRVDAARLAALRTNPEAYLKLPPALDDRQGQRKLYEQALASDTAGRYGVTAYARVHCAATTAGMADRTVLQYWLFYLYNDYYNVHEGDWEMVQVVLDGTRRPLYAAYAQHNSYSWRRWDEVLTENRTAQDGTLEEHPRVYVARGSHASYFQYRADGYGNDRVTDARDFLVPSVRLLPGPDEEESAFAWLRFPGRWGEAPAPGRTCAAAACNAGPVGPVYNSDGAKWRAPLEWGGQRLTRDDLIENGTARVLVRGSARVHVYDEQNRHTGPLVTGRLEVAIPGSAHLTRPGSGVTTVLLPGFTERSKGRVEIEGGPFRGLSILIPAAGGALEAQFPAVALGVTGIARLELGTGNLALRVDADGDGTFERTMLPLNTETP
jgi:hypothetical protein